LVGCGKEEDDYRGQGPNRQRLYHTTFVPKNDESSTVIAPPLTRTYHNSL
jgi:hypothetical protein